MHEVFERRAWNPVQGRFDDRGMDQLSRHGFILPLLRLARTRLSTSGAFFRAIRRGDDTCPTPAHARLVRFSIFLDRYLSMLPPLPDFHVHLDRRAFQNTIDQGR